MTPSNIMFGFKATGIAPFDKNVFSPDQFLSVYATDRLVENTVAERSQPRDASTPNLSDANISNASTSSAQQIRPFGKWPPRKENTAKRRKGKSQVFTDTLFRFSETKMLEITEDF